MTTTEDRIRAARVAELQQRRAAASRSAVKTSATAEVVRGSARREVAVGSKVVATGAGFTAMLGLVAAMGFANRSSSAEVPPIPVMPATDPVQVVVMLHSADGSVRPLGTSAEAGATSNVAADPVVLTAQPVVRPAPVSAVSPTPSGRTSGSR